MGKLAAIFVVLVGVYVVFHYDLLNTGPANSDMPPEFSGMETAAEAIISDTAGLQAPPFVVMALNKKSYFANEIFSNFELPGTENNLAGFDVVDQVENCQFAPVSGGMTLANVHIGTGQTATNFHAATEHDMISSLISWISFNNAKPFEAKPLDAAIDPDALTVVDVAITDETNIIYLVLQSYQSGVVWNIHTAPKTRIANVAVLSYGPAGVVGLDENVQLQMMDARQNPDCLAPTRNPRNVPDTLDLTTLTPELRVSAEKSAQDRFNVRQLAYFSYEAWFQNTFGISSEAELIGLDNTSHVLVGSVPETDEQRISYTPLTGQTVRVTSGDMSYISTSPEEATQLGLEAYADLLGRATGSNTAPDILSGMIQGTQNRVAENQPDAVFDVDILTTARMIKYERTLKLSDILSLDEALPPEQLQLLYVNARARQLAMKECELILRVLAKDCAVHTVQAVKGDQGTYQLSATLAFNPTDPAGQSSQADYLNPTVLLSLNNEGIEVPVDAQQKGRVAYYERAHKACAAVRKVLGSCVVETIQFETTRVWNDDSKLRMTALAKLASRGSESDGNDTITSAVNAMLAADI
ncbi:hypothetical protein [Parasulfitobacter algicola]|uniref:Uncharacterized protein n=1 Tax=Parasulfitobacter algicola TaxID=2614809 RepID=A0ABX2IZ72_9RHOB|nr:hypothetical protein [Sulfitobacter algicola]NSX56665.1 hypothetical protein [Sulfitobacter algicola]